MNSVTTIRAATAPGAFVTRDPAALGAFIDPGHPAALWQRQPPAGVQSWLEALDPDSLPRARIIVSPDAVADVVTQIFDAASLPQGAERHWLQEDIVGLAALFAGLMSARYLRLRLDVVTTNACRKFHIDAVTARLVCTYRGTGTQYGHPVNDGDPRDIVTAPTGAPVLLRGTRWPTDPPSDLLHRSPPIEGTGETRLLLVLDPVDDPEDDI